MNGNRPQVSPHQQATMTILLIAAGLLVAGTFLGMGYVAISKGFEARQRELDVERDTETPAPAPEAS